MRSRSSGAVHHHVIIAGAGPAGLAVGACLRKAGVPFEMLEKSDRVGAAWHGHYDRLCLHTSKSLSELPFVSCPKHYPRYPSRDQVIAYLEDYARRFDIQPMFSQQLVSAQPFDGGWDVQTQDANYRASNLVMATGYNREPNIPAWPGQDSFSGEILHSAQYRNGEPFRGCRVLVVGCGNSGGEIAIDLHEHGAKPAIAIRNPVNVIPRELLGIPVTTLALAESRLPPKVVDTLNAPVLRIAMGDLAQIGFRKPSKGPMTAVMQDGRVPLIDVGTVDLVRRGHVAVFPGIECFVGNSVMFVDGRRAAFDAVILATGYRPRVDTLLQGASSALDERGMPLSSGEESSVPGLYFCGYRVAATGMLREVGLEARRIAGFIARSHSRHGK